MMDFKKLALPAFAVAAGLGLAGCDDRPAAPVDNEYTMEMHGRTYNVMEIIPKNAPDYTCTYIMNSASYGSAEMSCEKNDKPSGRDISQAGNGGSVLEEYVIKAHDRRFEVTEFVSNVDEEELCVHVFSTTSYEGTEMVCFEP